MFALPVVLAGAALLCLAGGAYARGQVSQALAVTVTGPGTITGQGISCRDGSGDGVETYADGTSVTLTAVPDSGASFSGWYGDCAGTATTCTLTVNAAKAVGATFTGGTGGGSQPLSVTVTGNGSVAGTGISCGNGATDCSESYPAGTSVTLTETPASGATFAGWSGACTGATATCTVTMSAAKSVSATFTGGTASAVLTVSVSGNGKVTGLGINCGAGGTDCTEPYALGTGVTLTETPSTGATFSGWAGACTGTTGVCTVSMTASKMVTANFSGATTQQATLTVTVTGSGRVLGPGINCGQGNTDCSENYAGNTTVTLAETPASGAAFAGWGGACSGATSSCTVTMTGSQTLTATFTQGSTQKILTVTVGGAGRVLGTGISCGRTTHDCSQAFNDGAIATLLATPASGATFLGWGGACSGTGPTCQVLMSSPKAVSASFSTPGGGGTTPTGGTFAAHSIGNPVVVRNSAGWGVTLRFFANHASAALLRLSLNGRLMQAFTFSPHSGTVLVGPFNVTRAGTYKFRLSLNDARGQSAEVIWNLCLSSNGCGAFRPVSRSFLRGEGVSAARTSTGFLVRVRFHASVPGVGVMRMSRDGRLVSSGTFNFRSGDVTVDLPARSTGFHQIVLTARNSAGRTFQLHWSVLIS